MFTIGQISLAAIWLLLVAAFINHRLAIARDARNKRADHAGKIIAAFRPEWEGLTRTNNDARTIMTPEAFNRHETAINDALPYFSFFTRRRISKIWYKLAYYEDDKVSKVPFYVQYADCGSLDKRRKYRPIIESRIQNIISLVNK